MQTRLYFKESKRMKTYTQEQLMSRSYNENDLIIKFDCYSGIVYDKELRKYVRVLYSDSTNSLMYSKSISTEEFEKLQSEYCKKEPLIVTMNYSSLYDGPSDKYKDGDLIEYSFDITEDDTFKLKEIRKVNDE
nr:MAG TPA: hypothetical protein [Caudoviricetes sp.]